MMDNDKDTFEHAGFVVLRQVIPYYPAINELRQALLVLLVRFGLSLTGREQLYDSGLADRFCACKEKRPDITGAIYDAMQSSLSLARLIHHPEITSKIAQLLNTREHHLSQFFRCLRIDVPGHNPNALGWHQDFMVTEKATLDASDGMTVWIPLNYVDKQRGTLELCVGSHHDRIRDVEVGVRNEQNASEYIKIPDHHIDKFEKYIVEADAGDVVLMSMNTLHRTVESQEPPIRFTAIGRFFRLASPGFVYGAPKYVASKLLE